MLDFAMKKSRLLLLLLPLSLSAQKPNIIFMIGDGMGPSYTAAYRYYHDDPKTKEVERTIYDELFVGSCSTYSYENPAVVTDSAAAATALATGVKTRNGHIGVDENNNVLPTLLEKAKLAGYQTAMVVTSTLTHATPASFIAHHNDREEEVEIAKDYLKKNSAKQLKFDLLMGGGLKYFKQAHKSFKQQLKTEKIALYTDVKSLDVIKKLPAMVFIDDNKPPFAIDAKKQGLGKLRTKKMTDKALSLMDEKRPFFMMIEGSQIDWCGHSNDIACVMREMDDFTEAIKVAKAYVDKHKNTLLIITADHSTGGLGIGNKISKKSTLAKKERKRKAYTWRPELIKAVNISAKEMTKKVYHLKSSIKMKDLFQKYMKIELTKKELKKIKEKRAKPCEKFNKCKLHDYITKLVDKRSETGWTTHGHTAVDVPIFAYGNSALLFHGFMDNTDISKKIATLLK